MRILCLILPLVGCLEPVHPPDSGDDPPAPEDIAPVEPPHLAISGIRVVDERGDTWSLEAAPWHPTVELLATLPMRAPSPFVFLLPRVREGDAEELLGDLARSPLRRANVDASIPLQVETTPFGARVRPTDRLNPGAYLIGVAAWTLGSPETTSRDEDAPLLGEAHVWTMLVSDTGGAALLSTWPPHGASAVPLDTRRFVARFSGPVDGVEDLVLHGERGRVAVRPSRIACEALGWSSGHCVALRWEGRLRPGAEYVVELGPRVVDASGSHVPGLASFQTGTQVQAEPEFLALDCALDELSTSVGCALLDDAGVTLRVRLNSPAIVTLQAVDRVDRTLAPRGEADLHVDAPPNTRLDARLSVETLGGHYHSEVLQLTTPERMSTVTISEVRANPLGREPTQETVEFVNYGREPVSLEGMSLADRGDRAGDILPASAPLAPGARALVVPENFDPDDPSDPRPPPGTALIRIGTSLASGGLSNGGEPLLRDSLGRRLSHVPTAVARAGLCWHRDDAVRAGEMREGPCTPGEP